MKEEKYCLESNFIIDLLRGKPNAVAIYEKTKGFKLFTTSVVLFEILRGEEKVKGKVDQFNELHKELEVLPFGEAEALQASIIERQLKSTGKKPQITDLFIATVAINNELTLISNDAGYDNFVGLKLKLMKY